MTNVGIIAIKALAVTWVKCPENGLLPEIFRMKT